MQALRLGSRAFSAVTRPATKLSTGIVGLDVVPNAREVLTQLYKRTLTDVQVMPAEVFYRQSVERFTRYRMEVVAKHEDVRRCGWAVGWGGGVGRGAHPGGVLRGCQRTPQMQQHFLTHCTPSTPHLPPTRTHCGCRLALLRQRLGAGRWRS
jgi:hypothetical protein